MASSNMKALLATLAVAGWQNRDRLGELLGKATGQKPGTPPTGTDPGIAAASSEDSVACLADCWVVAVRAKELPVDWAS